MTRSKLFKALTLEDLTNEMNEFFNKMEVAGKTVTVEHSHQFQIGEAETKTIALNGQPQVKYFFILILFYSIL